MLDKNICRNRWQPNFSQNNENHTNAIENRILYIPFPTVVHWILNQIFENKCFSLFLEKHRLYLEERSLFVIHNPNSYQ